MDRVIPTKVIRVLALALGCALLPSCASVRIDSDWDPAVDFSKLSCWSWKSPPQKRTGRVRYDEDGPFAGRVRRAVERTMKNRGFTKLQTGEPDFRIDFFLVVEDKTDVTAVNNYYGYGPGWGWRYGYHSGWGYGPQGFGTQVVADQYKQGTLILDIVSPDTNQLIWRGSASARLADNPKPQKSQARIDDAVQKILDRFPPEPSELASEQGD